MMLELIAELTKAITVNGIVGVLVIVIAYQTAQVKALLLEVKEDKKALLGIISQYASLSEGVKQTLERVVERLR